MIIAIIVGALVSMAVSFVWYGPLFGKVWTQYVGITPEMMAAAKAKGMGKTYVFALIGELLTAYVIYYFLTMLGITTIAGAFELMAWIWLGFLIPICLNATLWEGKPWNLFFIHAGNRIVSICVSAAAIVLIAF